MRSIAGKIYRALPFKRQMMHAIRAVAVPPQSVYQHLHFHGPFEIKNADGKRLRLCHYGTYVENEIFWTGLYGNFEGQSLRLWEKLCKRADVIFDIGANTGVYALLAKVNSPNARVYAFEPIPAVFQKLKANVEANGFDVVCDDRAVSDVTRSAVIYLPNDEHLYSVTVDKNLNPSGTSVKTLDIQTISLSDYCLENGIDKVDLLKIDVETHEPEVLAGMREILERDKPTMLVEILLDDVGRRVEEIIDGLGYLFFHVDENNGPYRDERLRGHSPSYNYLICQLEIARNLDLI